MRINAITTGSSGNCYLIELCSFDKVYYALLDCGITYSNLLAYLNELDISLTKIAFLILTHEHGDHIKGVQKLLKNNKHLSIIAPKSLIEYLQLNSFENTVFDISYSEKLSFADFDIFSFEVSHDCKECMGFIIKENLSEKKVCFMNDLGEYNDLHVQLIKQSDLVFLESNYDENIVHTSNMHPTYLNRLTSSVGHLSNLQSQNLCSSSLKENQKIVLTHISENMNKYYMCYKEMRKTIDKLGVINYELLISYQNTPTGWIE